MESRESPPDRCEIIEKDHQRFKCECVFTLVKYSLIQLET